MVSPSANPLRLTSRPNPSPFGVTRLHHVFLANAGDFISSRIKFVRAILSDSGGWPWEGQAELGQSDFCNE